MIAPQPASPSLERQSKWDLLASRRRSTDAHTASVSSRQPRSSSEPRRSRGKREDTKEKESGHSSSPHPHRSNSERAKRRSANIGYLDPYPEEGSDEYDFKFPDTDLDTELFFESKQQKYRKNKATGSKSLFIKPTTEKLESPVQSLRKKKEKSKGSNASSRSNSLDSNKSKESVTPDSNVEEKGRKEDLQKQDNVLEDDSDNLNSEDVVGEQSTDTEAVPGKDSSETTQDPSSRGDTVDIVQTVSKNRDSDLDTSEKLNTVQKLDLVPEENCKQGVVQETKCEIVTESFTEDTEKTQVKVDSVEATERKDTNSTEASGNSVEEKVDKKVEVSEVKDSCVVLKDKVDCTSESLSQETPDTEAQNVENITEAKTDTCTVVTETVKLRNKTDTQEDRKAKAQTWYKGEAVSFDTTNIPIDLVSDDWRVRSQDKVSKESRTQKAQSWCAAGPTPIPPPRRKSRSPKKSPSLEVVSKEEHKLQPNRSFLHSQSVDLPVSNKLQKSQTPEIKQSLLSSSAPISIRTATSSPASSTTSLSPIRSPKKRQAPKPPGSTSSSPLSSVPTSPVNRPIKAIHPSPRRQTTKETRSTLTSTSSEGSPRPTSLDLHKVYDLTKQPSTEDLLPVAPPRTRSKRGRKGSDSKTHPNNKSLDIPDNEVKTNQSPLIKSQSLPAPDLVSDLTLGGSSEKHQTDNNSSHDAKGHEDKASDIESKERSVDISESIHGTVINKDNANLQNKGTENLIGVQSTSVDLVHCAGLNSDKTEDSVKARKVHEYVNVPLQKVEGEPQPIIVEYLDRTVETNISVSESQNSVKFPPADIQSDTLPPKTSFPPSSTRLSHDYVNVSTIPPVQPPRPIKDSGIHEYVNVSDVAPPPESLEPTKTSAKTHEYVNVSVIAPPSGSPESAKTTATTHEYVNVSIAPPPEPNKSTTKTHEYVNVSLSTPSPGSEASQPTKKREKRETHEYVNVLKAEPPQLVGEPTDILSDSREKELPRNEEEQIYFPFDQIEGIEKDNQTSSSDSDGNSEDIVTQNSKEDNILKWVRTEDIVAGTSVEEGENIVTRDGQPYEISTDYNNLSADDISLLVEHGFDYEIMDAAARKRELDRLRAQFFKPKESPSAPTLIDLSSGTVTTPSNDNTNTNNSSSAPQATTVIVIGNDNDYKSPIEDGSTNKTPKYVTNHTTTINVTDDNEKIDNDGVNGSNQTAFPIALEPQVTTKNEHSPGDTSVVATVEDGDSSSGIGAHKSKIILDLDEHQFVPEIEVEKSAPYKQTVAIESDAEDEEEIVIGSTDPENSTPGLVAVSDPFDPWTYSTNKPGLYKEDSWDEPVDSKKDSGFGEFSWGGDSLGNKDKEKENTDITDAPLVDINEPEKEPDNNMATKSSKPVAHAFGSPIYSGDKLPRDRSPKKPESSNDQVPKDSVTVTTEVVIEKPPSSPQKSNDIGTGISLMTPELPVKTSNGAVTDFDQLASTAPLVQLDFGHDAKEDTNVTSASPPLPSTPPPMALSNQNALFELDPFFSGPSSTDSTEAAPSGQTEKQFIGFGSSPTSATGESFGQSSHQFEVSWDRQQKDTKPSPNKDKTPEDIFSVHVTQGARPKETTEKNVTSLQKATSPERKSATSPERKTTSIEIKATSPERKAAEKKTTSPDRKPTSPERKATSPDRKVTTVGRATSPPTSPERKSVNLEFKTTSPERKEISSSETNTDYTPYVYKKSKEDNKDAPTPTSPTSPKAVTSTSIRLSSPERPLSPSAEDLAILDAMDPVTGLRRTNPTPIDKAMQFVGTTETEPTYRSLKLTINEQPSSEIEKGRQEILGESRMKKKTTTSWQEHNNIENRKDVPEQILASQKRYEERRKSKDLSTPPPSDKKTNYKYDPGKNFLIILMMTTFLT